MKQVTEKASPVQSIEWVTIQKEIPTKSLLGMLPAPGI